MEAADPEEFVSDKEESKHCKHEVAPLIRGGNESTDQACNNHYFINEDGIEDCGPWKSCGEEDIEKEELNNVTDIHDYW
jgi:hypothetical protein